MQFGDRYEAGERLAEVLRERLGDDVVVLGLPRGGVPVAEQVATALHAPLDVLVVRKVGAPGHAEYGIGAVGEEDVLLLDDDALARIGATRDDVAGTVAEEREELARRVACYRRGRAAVPIAGRHVVVVDDGLATGVSATAAVRTLRSRGVERITVAVPVGAPASVERLRGEADDVVCLDAPRGFTAVSTAYREFGQTSDEEVVAILARAGERLTDRREVEIPTDGVVLPGHLWVPPSPNDLVVFAHGSGSSRDSPRNQHVASLLNASGSATLLFDLLTDAESGDRDNTFDIGLLGGRLTAAARWARARSDLAGLPLGLFGASTGAAAALDAAVDLGGAVHAVVSRGGRPDLSERIGAVRAAVLLIVGSRDSEVLALNRAAAERLAGPREVAVVEGASHLFEEPGTLDEVAALAGRWFADHRRAARP